MSIEHLQEYARRCAVDPELRARAEAIGFSDGDAHMQHAESMGLEFSVEDMIRFRDELVSAEGEVVELSEEDLEKIAGGGVSVTAALVVGGVIGGVAATGATAAGVATAVAGRGW